MLLESHSGHLPEQSGKIGCINVQMVCNCRQCYIFREVLGNIFGGIFDDPAALFGSHEQIICKYFDIVLESIAYVVAVL